MGLHIKVVPLSGVEEGKIMPWSLQPMQDFGAIKLAIPFVLPQPSPTGLKLVAVPNTTSMCLVRSWLLKMLKWFWKNGPIYPIWDFGLYRQTYFHERAIKGSHEWIIEFKKPPKDLRQFVKVLDQSLQEVNSDYETKRYNNTTLNPPTVHQARKTYLRLAKTARQTWWPTQSAQAFQYQDLLEELLCMNR